MVKKKLGQDDYWAQQIIRAQSGGKDYIFALVRRKYSDDDIEPVGPGEYIGLKETKSYPKMTDNDPDSTTFGKRIDKPNAEAIGLKMKYEDEFTPENIKKYQAMFGINDFGETIFIYKFKQISIRADKVNEFWTISQDDIYNKYILKEQVIKIEESKSNTRRRVSKKAG
mgnify:FL=1